MSNNQLISGRVWKYGDGVNNDVIFPQRYAYKVTELSQMAHYALEDLDPEFARFVQPGDVIVAGRNWGHGFNPHHAIHCLKQARVGAVIALSFAHSWYRHAIHQGLLIIPCGEAVESLQAHQYVQIDVAQNLIIGPSGSYSYCLPNHDVSESLPVFSKQAEKTKQSGYSLNFFNSSFAIT